MGSRSRYRSIARPELHSVTVSRDRHPAARVGLCVEPWGPWCGRRGVGAVHGGGQSRSYGLQTRCGGLGNCGRWYCFTEVWQGGLAGLGFAWLGLAWLGFEASAKEMVTGRPTTSAGKQLARGWRPEAVSRGKTAVGGAPAAYGERCLGPGSLGR